MRDGGSGTTNGGDGRDDRGAGPDRIGGILEGFLRKMGIEEEVARQDALVRWEDVVGERIAKVTRARAVDGGVLFVEVASSAWLNELNLLRHDILRRLNAGSGKGRVERIVFRLSEHREPGRREE